MGAETCTRIKPTQVEADSSLSGLLLAACSWLPGTWFAEPGLTNSQPAGQVGSLVTGQVGSLVTGEVSLFAFLLL